MSSWRWGVAGGALGVLVATAAFAPAAWLARALDDATEGRLLLADARGTVWRGSAVMVLTGGVGSLSASALPGRLQWTLGLDGAALSLLATQACCINGELRLRIRPGLHSLRVELPPAADPARAIGQWPASWLVGLGTPWNTVQPTGTLQFSSPGLTLEQLDGRWLFTGRADVALDGLASRLSTLETLGSYRLTLSGNADRGEPAQIALATAAGPLQLSGSGSWVVGPGKASRLRFQGQGSAAPGFEAPLGGLLNIIGRRQGALSVISIG